MDRTHYSIAGLLVLAALWFAQANAETHDYHVVVGENLDRLQVRAQLAQPTTALRSRDRDAWQHTQRVGSCAGAQRPRIQGRALRTDGSRCIQYEFDLVAARKPSRRAQYWQFKDNRMASPATWLWLPRLSPETEVRVHFDLPAGVNVSVPWQPIDGDQENAYRFGASPASFRSDCRVRRF